ncbi:PTS lactose/cellobiose transporter subunit IIA [Streptococcus merionis]|uniref:PTS lactose/cellobiose transporter subunit IIA n=1 Tax=Streptococcus merionis TaxID=400065 RepID=UPI0026EBEDDD|nr:PTS lactose/cellobiose transporter subunit IIA [Streptococcus merionis]
MAEVSLESIMGLIMNSGEAKSNAIEAIAAAKASNFSLADSKLEQAKVSLIEAHQSQTSMLTQEAQGNQLELTLLTVHSQDHLMTAITFVDIAKEIIDLYRLR